ncbi:transcriptional regulator [Flavobacterium sp. TBRC 19031]|uniref:transcriptional regulator n=1 Tax=Flavobacterium mekongense TaxID=3379707 RepID=UPI00399A3B42
MNYIKHLTGFFERVTQDKTLNPTHVSLYIALFQFWNCNRFKNPISISRDEVMRISKISSKATYHKCLKHLHALGYIKYEPSYNPFRGSHVIMFNFAADLKPQPKTSSKNEPFLESVGEQVVNKQNTGNEQAVIPYINNTNIQNKSNESKHAHANSNEITNAVFSNGSVKEEEKSCAKKEEATDDLLTPRVQEIAPSLKSQKPDWEEIVNYFTRHEFVSTEAEKFFNYYESNGWLVGGKNPMVDWQAAAKNWMHKTQIFNQKPTVLQSKTANHLTAVTNKNYAEPL